MSSHKNCCDEYLRLSRRQFMAATGAGGVAMTIPAWFPRVVFAQDYCSNRDVIVSVFLRGAADGLSLCVPYGDAPYYTARPTLAVLPPDPLHPTTTATDLDGFFGFPPAMTSLMPAYQAGHLLVVHACGSTDPSRSHFDAQRYMEVGKPADSTLFTGWLGRHLFSVAPTLPNAVLRAVGIGYGLQRTLEGAPNAIPIPDLDQFGLNGNNSTTAMRLDALDDMFQLVADPVKAAAITTQATIALLNTINFAGYAPGGGAVYPGGSFGYALKTTAALIRADVGVEAVSIDVSGWDTHNSQGVLTGTMATLMTTLSQGLAAFHQDMNSGNGKNVTTVCMSEFGRRVKENGTAAIAGTDHGHGNAMIVMGKDIAGGRVLRQWPGLATNQLFQGLDLQVTIDFRDILAEIVSRRLGNPDLSYVFPGYTPTFRGIVGGCQIGDMNCDNKVDGADVGPFVQALTDSTGYSSSHPTCNRNNADVNLDGVVNEQDAGAFAQQVLQQP
jgi:uncharacterized protein (DUF1501 family)